MKKMNGGELAQKTKRKRNQKARKKKVVKKEKKVKARNYMMLKEDISKIILTISIRDRRKLIIHIIILVDILVMNYLMKICIGNTDA